MCKCAASIILTLYLSRDAALKDERARIQDNEIVLNVCSRFLDELRPRTTVAMCARTEAAA
jgi:hypothetical protein